MTSKLITIIPQVDKILKMAEREGSNPRNGFPFTRFPSVRLQPSLLELLILLINFLKFDNILKPR